MYSNITTQEKINKILKIFLSSYWIIIQNRIQIID